MALTFLAGGVEEETKATGDAFLALSCSFACSTVANQIAETSFTSIMNKKTKVISHSFCAVAIFPKSLVE